jgi:multisubunit Na+/H+ antiporter MnhG subunit
VVSWHGRKRMIQICLYTKMKKKIALNTFYTIGIVVSVVGIKWAYTSHNYPVLGLLIATALFFLYLKINIVKEVRSGIKEQEVKINSKDQELKNTSVTDNSSGIK